MTILAGVIARQPGGRVPESAGSALRRAISRASGESVREYRRGPAVLLKADVGAFGEPAWHEDADGSVSLLAGEPLLAVGDPACRRSRTEDLAALHAGWTRGDWTLLTKVRGVFCAAHYVPATGRLTLVTDKLGIRPLYYWTDENYVVFATALRILEAQPLVAKIMDLRGVTEAVTLGAPLGDRTPYVDVRRLAAAEIMQVSSACVERRRYWDWGAIEPAERPQAEQLGVVWERFSTAVSCRLGGDHATVAFLSGGLDSRCIVAALRARSVQVRTLTFAERGSQEGAFAAAFARAVGTDHEEWPHPSNGDLAAAARAAASRRGRAGASRPGVDRPQLVWGGDGGSVALGGVGQSRAMVDALRAGNLTSAIDLFVRQECARVAHRVLAPGMREIVAGLPVLGLREELQAIDCRDPGRALHCFLLVHDQRRYSLSHFEDIDLHRLEVLTPFFDSDLLQAVCAVPVDWCLYHGFYQKWLGCFPPAVTSIPWQTYPGHAPCPLPIPRGLTDQWEASAHNGAGAARRLRLLRQAAELLDAPAFPSELLRRSVLRWAAWIHRRGWRDYSYIIQQAVGYHRYWTRSEGRWLAPCDPPCPHT